MSFAFLTYPHLGGIYTVYRSLRAGLEDHGIGLKWAGVGPEAQASYDDPHWATERDLGIVLAGDVHDEHRQAQELIRFLETSGVDGVFMNALGGRLQTNAVRYLDPAIRRIMIVHSIAPGQYAAAYAVRDYVHATVCVSPRIRSDLTARYGFANARTHSVPNAVDGRMFDLRRSARPDSDPLRVLFLGRVKDEDKGVFWLPGIIERLPDAAVEFHVVGDGPDLPELKRRCARFGGRVRFWGRVPPNEVPEACLDRDVILLPSRYEGLGLSLVEAMATGCVAVASRIRQVTDFVVEDGVSGFLFPIGDIAGAAEGIRRLAVDRELWQRMSIAARGCVSERFALGKMAQSYERIITEVLANPVPTSAPLDVQRWSYPRGMRAGLRSWLPTPVKNFLRGLRA